MNIFQKTLLTLTIVFSGFAAKDSLLAQQSDKGADNNSDYVV